MATTRRIARRINEVFNLNANHIYYFYLGNWYHHLRDFPGILVDSNGYVCFNTINDYETSPYLQHGVRLHVRGGISSMPGYIQFTEEQLYILNQIVVNDVIAQEQINDQAERRPRNIDSIVRNSVLVREIKELRDNTCQICGSRLQIGPNSFYSEVHHIRPLGNPHNGPDITSNMLCVCPNCHKTLDYGFVEIDFESIQNIAGHIIDAQYVEYHNGNVD
ncbi:MAG: HNH endonuclease [Chitinophagales bacterium]|nr:HNH endonuclease [Chitinophagales bacterium]